MEPSTPLANAEKEAPLSSKSAIEPASTMTRRAIFHRASLNGPTRHEFMRARASAASCGPRQSMHTIPRENNTRDSVRRTHSLQVKANVNVELGGETNDNRNPRDIEEGKTEQEVSATAYSASSTNSKPQQEHVRLDVGERFNFYDAEHQEDKRMKALALGTLAAIGAVYGDLGTSPLYTYNTILAGPTVPTEDEILAGLSLIFWALTLIVTIKYMVFILQADLNGEGGIFVIYQLIKSASSAVPRFISRAMFGVSIVGVALLAADGALTPAITVFTATSGLTVEFPTIPQTAIVGATCGILVLLFLTQQLGSSILGKVYGPVLLVWFAVLFGSGLYNVVQDATIFRALNPAHAIWGLGHTWSDGNIGFLKLGDVLLALTGAEACYADIGHFGKTSVRIGWLFIAYPALVIQYLGQGVMLLQTPSLANDTAFFYHQLPGGWFWVLFVTSFFASIFASQAMISGAFSTLHQAIALDAFPPVDVHHTSRKMYGQVYIPSVNWILMIITIAMVAGTQSSTLLTAAYGVSVAGSFVCTSIAYTCYLVYVRKCAWYVWPLFPAVFLTLDMMLFAGTISKVATGGYITLTIAFVLLLIMVVWHQGRVDDRKAELSALGIAAEEVAHTVETTDSKVLGQTVTVTTRLNATISALESMIGSKGVGRPAGVGVFLTRGLQGIPDTLIRYQAITGTLPETVILLTMRPVHVPFVAPADKYHVGSYGRGVYRVVVTVGFAEPKPYVDECLRECQVWVPDMVPVLDGKTVTYYMGYRTFVVPDSVPWVVRVVRKTHLALYDAIKRLLPGYSRMLLAPANFMVISTVSQAQ